MRKLFVLFLTALIFTACTSVPETQDSVAVVSEEVEEKADEADNRGKIAASNSYYVIDDSETIESLDSAEYKMLINLDDYNPELLWELMKEAAAETGVTIEEEDDPMKRKFRRIRYMDSEFGMMNNFGYVLRFRQKFEEYVALGSSDNVNDDKYDVTIKFRDSDLQKSLSIPLSVGDEFEEIEKKPEMEADISPYGIKYSWAIKVKPKVKDFGEFDDLFEPSLESYARLYPDLLDIGLPAETVIEPVGGLTILEEKIEPAILVLSCGAEMEVAFSKFFMDGKELVAEASFDFDTEYEIKDEDGDEVEKTMTLEDFKQTEAFYKSILEKYNDRIDFGWSKTKFVYDTLFPEVAEE